MSQVGNDVHSALAVDFSEKHLCFVNKSFNDPMAPLKIKRIWFNKTIFIQNT